MTDLRQAAQLTLSAIENGESFDHLENVIAELLRKALSEDMYSEYSQGYTKGYAEGFNDACRYAK